MNVTVGDIKNVPWKKTKATFSIVIEGTAGRFVLKDCRLVEGINGMYVAGPSKQYNNKEGDTTYFQFLDLNKDAQNTCLTKIQEEYDHTVQEYRYYGQATYNKKGDEDNPIPF